MRNAFIRLTHGREEIRFAFFAELPFRIMDGIQKERHMWQPITESLLIATLLTAALIGLPHLIPGRKCPQCGLRKIEHIDSMMFYDPAPQRELLSCNNCDGDFVRYLGKWIPRDKWHDEDDQKIWSELKQDRAL